MSLADIFLIVPSPVLSGMIWFVLIALFMYMARTPAHLTIRSLSRVLHKACRLTAVSVMHAQALLAARNREVLLATGREASERIIEREFDRITASVRKDLSAYPALHRRLSEDVTRLDEAYENSTDVPPTPPGWVDATEAVANIPAKGDPMVAKILDDIHQSLVKAQITATEEYRKSCQERHSLLKRMMPEWRRVSHELADVDKHINSLLDRSKAIDRHMEEHENIVKGTDRALRMLSSSSLTHFFISAFVLAIAVGGAMINFNLIARPMAEMVGGTNFIGGYQVADIAALVIILVEISMGLFLMESLRITRLFPIIGALPDKMRIRMIWVTFTLLFLLACVEAGLAFMRELLMQDELATSALLRGDTEFVIENEFLWITTLAQMGMGFILPFALVFVAIPLETFVHSLRTVLGIAGVGLLRAFAYTIRLIGNISRYMGDMLLHVYDLVIFAPLWIERLVKMRKRRVKPEATVKEVHHTDTDPSIFREAS